MILMNMLMAAKKEKQEKVEKVEKEQNVLEKVVRRVEEEHVKTFLFKVLTNKSYDIVSIACNCIIRIIGYNIIYTSVISII